jgi:hypothetical protein
MVQNKKDFQFAKSNYQDNFLDLITRKKITKHYSDITDIITEEDIKIVKTEFGISVSFRQTSNSSSHEIIR